MDLTTTLILSVLIIVLAGCLWCLICNQRTYKQRLAMLPKPSDPKFWEKNYIYDQVSYAQHFRALVFFKNPMNLYHSHF